jgi:carbon-monoxide dehydrogenase small subunit
VDEAAGVAVRRPIRFTLNGERVEAQAAPHETLVELLRESFGLFGARESCGQGLCGCCTVLVNGSAVSGCLYLASLVEGAEVRTIEEAKDLDAVQQAFIERAAFQCGFCTPGMVLMTRQLLDEIPEPSEDDIRHYLSGNLCRCATYPEILEAVKLAAKKRKAAA